MHVFLHARTGMKALLTGTEIHTFGCATEHADSKSGQISSILHALGNRPEFGQYRGYRGVVTQECGTVRHSAKILRA
jgi:hypothetical protein